MSKRKANRKSGGPAGAGQPEPAGEAAGRGKDEPEAADSQERPRSRAADWARSLIGGFLIFVVIQTFVLQTFTITSGSMESTLLVGDFLVLSKSAYGATIPGTTVRTPGYSHPKRGDIIVFRGHHEPLDVVKRLIGMPGDTLFMVDGVLYRNRVALDEPYVERTYPEGDGWHPAMQWQADFLVHAADRDDYMPTRDNWGPIVVPEDAFFVLGDNRDDSLDSRYYGFISPEQVKGRAVALYFSFDREANGPLPLLSSVRWERVGDRLR